MHPKDLKVNQLLEITVDEEGSPYKNLPSRIEEVSSKYLHVSIPMKRGQILPIRVRQKLTMTLNQRGRSFQFETIVVSRQLHPIPVLIVIKPESFIEIQRRQWVRVPASIHLRYCIVNEAEASPIYEGTTVDISGGGLCLLTKDPIEAGDIVDIELNFPGREPLFCQLKILRLLEKASKEGETSKAVCEYNEINENQRDIIVSFIFEKQREWIQKGLL